MQPLYWDGTKFNSDIVLNDYTRAPAYAVDTSSLANAYIVTLNPAPASYVDGMELRIKIGHTNTGSSSLNANGLGVVALLDPSGTALAAGVLKGGCIYSFVYNSSLNAFTQLAGGGDNTIQDGSIGLSKLDTSVQTNINKAATSLQTTGGTVTGDLNSQMITELDASLSVCTGTKKADTNCWGGQCIYANAPTSGTLQLSSTIVNNLRFQNYSLCVRLKTANNTATADAIKIDVQRNNSGTFNSVTSRTLKPTEFINTSDYQEFYINFKYAAPKTTNNEFRIVVTLLTQTAAFEVDLDSIVIMPAVVGIVLS
jgi:hypothetical protein